jgi:hypothetical protein
VGDAGHAKSEFTSFLAARETRADGREEQEEVKKRGTNIGREPSSFRRSPEVILVDFQ